MLLPRILVLALGCALASGCSGEDDDKEEKLTTAGVPGARRYEYRPAMMIDTAKTYAATITTAKGKIELELDPKGAPLTVNNFVFLARFGFYDGLTFHRVESSFVIQGGDPAGNGTGGPGYTIPDEASSLLHVDGALAMGKSREPDSAGSQFYITIGAQPDLDGRYTVFGHVTAGLEIVRTIRVGDAITSIVVVEK